MESKKKKKKKKKSSGLKLFGKILLGIFIFILLLLLFIRSPWGQNIITKKLVSYISGKTNTEVQIDKLFITFGGDISLEGVYFEDKQGDTLIYSEDLQADIPLWPILQGKGFSIDNLEWSGVRANIKRKDTINGFNYSFLMDVFVPASDSTATATPADSTASAMAIHLGDLDLKNFKINYDDQYLGIDLKVNLGGLEVEMREFNLDSMVYRLGDVSLKNTQFSYIQTKPFPEQPDQPAAPMPLLAVDALNVNNVVGDYQSIPDGFLTDLDIKELLLKMPQADLEQNKIEIEMLGLKDSEILVKTSETTTTTNNTQEVSTGEPSPFEWPVWNVVINEISLVNDDLKFLLNGAESNQEVFNPNALVMLGLDLQANDLALQNQSFNGNVKKFNFREPSGLNLKQAQFKVTLNEDKLDLQGLTLQLNDNYIQGRLNIDYNSLDQFIQNPQHATVDLNLPEFRVDLKDLYRFQPQLRQNQYFEALSKKALFGRLRAQGELSSVKIEDANIHWGANTSLAAEGEVFNATDPENLKFDFSRVRLNSKRGDIRALVEGLDLGIQLPQTINLAGSFSGSPDDIQVDAVLNSSAGKIDVAGRFVTAPGIAFNADLQVTELEVGQLLQNKSLGPVSLKVQASGAGASMNDLDAMVQGNISSLTYNKYNFKDIELYAELEDGEGFAEVDYKDANLNMELESFVELDSVAPKMALQLNLIGADLQALGFVGRPIKTGLELRATFEGNTENFDVNANINDGVFVYENESYLLGKVDLMAHVTTRYYLC